MDSKQTDIFTVAQAADYLGITTDGIKYHLYKSKRLKGTMVGRDVLFNRQELDAFKASGLKPRGKSGRLSND